MIKLPGAADYHVITNHNKVGTYSFVTNVITKTTCGTRYQCCYHQILGYNDITVTVVIYAMMIVTTSLSSETLASKFANNDILTRSR